MSLVARVKKRLSPAPTGDGSQLWPIESYDVDDEPRFLFVLTPPYSGSTALASLFTTAPRTMLLQPAGEGQWLVPGMCGQARWEPETVIDWRSVRSVWLARYQLVAPLVGGVDLVIEKSPPNLVRWRDARRQFKSSTFCALIRNPFATAASSLHRVHHPERASLRERLDKLELLGTRWVARARILRDAIDNEGIDWLTYEGLCADPAGAMSMLMKNNPELSGVDATAELRVKDYPPQRISNQNDRQLAWLKPDDIAAIQAGLATGPDLVDYFGYDMSCEQQP